MTADADLSKVLGRVLVSEALNQLSEPDRVVLFEAHYLGWTTRQIADDLDITEAVVKCRLHKALHSLRLKLI